MKCCHASCSVWFQNHKIQTTPYRYEGSCLKVETYNTYALTLCFSDIVYNIVRYTRYSVLLYYHTRDSFSWPHTQSYPIFSDACDFQSMWRFKVSIALIAGDPCVARDTWGNGRTGIAWRVTPVLRTYLIPFITRRAHISYGHERRQVRDDVIMLIVVQQVDPLRCSYLTVKHDAVISQAWIHHYPILRQMALKGL